MWEHNFENLKIKKLYFSKRIIHRIRFSTVNMRNFIFNRSWIPMRILRALPSRHNRVACYQHFTLKGLKNALKHLWPFNRIWNWVSISIVPEAIKRKFPSNRDKISIASNYLFIKSVQFSFISIPMLNFSNFG